MHQKAVDQLEGGSGCPGERWWWPELEWGGRDGEKRLVLDPGLEVESTKLANVLDAKREEGEGKGDLLDFGLNHCRSGGAIYWRKEQGNDSLVEYCYGGGEGVVICGCTCLDVYIWDLY